MTSIVPPAPARSVFQGLALVHFSYQRKHFLRDTFGGFSVSVTKTAQVELRSGRVSAPAAPAPARSVFALAFTFVSDAAAAAGQGRHTSTSRLNVSTSCGICWVVSACQ